LKQVAVIRLNLKPDEPRALKLLVGDNELEHLAEIDDRKLSNILKEIKDTNNLLGTGYDEMMLANLIFVTRPSSEIKDFNEANAWVGMPDYDEGIDVFRLIVSFEDEKDRLEFMQQKQISNDVMKRNGRIWSMRWPDTKQRDLKSVRFVDS